MQKHSLVTLACFALLISTGTAMAANDPTGKQDLGVDITTAGKNQNDNIAFYRALTVDQQGHVKKACAGAVKKPSDHAVEVIEFCKNVTAM
jgi:hypothetical protein